MKIGILTFHSQLNYGGVLQCWALQTALERMGHDVVVIDRWLGDDNYMLERGYGQWSKKHWIKFWIRSLLGLGDLNPWLRMKRTKKFIRERMKLTPYHFVEWREAPEELGVDRLVVGSDQVWHCGDWGDPSVYLLEGAPEVKAIAYAASYGLTEIPAEWTERYKRGLGRFKAISCREAEGAEICRKLGYEAAHVVDPTLLAFYGGKREEGERRDLVCYFLSEDLNAHWDELAAFARAHRCRVKVLLNGTWALPLPCSWARFKVWIRGMWRKLFSRVKVLDGAGPAEFLAAFKGAKWVVSDSFHALMFAIINGCDARIIRPSSEMRRKMFARIEEFAAHTRGPLIADSVRDALGSLDAGQVEYDQAWLKRRCEESREWLRKVLD